MVDLGERLASAMKDRGVSVSQLASAVGVSYQAVKKILDGKTATLKGENLLKISAHLTVNAEWLATGKGPKDPAELGNAKGSGAMVIMDTAALVARSNQEPLEPNFQRTVSETEWALLQDFALLPDPEKQTLRQRLAEKADEARRKADEMFFGKHNIPAPVPDERVAEAFGAPPPPTGAGSWKKITPVPAAPRPGKKRVGDED